MRTILLFLLLTTFRISYSQKYDTMQYDVDKEGGFRRIRELNPKGEIRKVWITNWDKGGEIKKSFSQYNSNNKKVTGVDSTFKNDKLIKIERKIGDTTEGDSQEFDSSGELTRRDITLHINDKYMVFQKYKKDSGWSYRAIIDGRPQDYILINEVRFEEAIKIYNDRLLLDKIIN